MSTYAAESIAEATVSLVVTRCQCAPDQMNHPGEVCPIGVEEDLGVVSYYHKKRHKRILWAIRNKLKGLKH